MSAKHENLRLIEIEARRSLAELSAWARQRKLIRNDQCVVAMYGIVDAPTERMALLDMLAVDFFDDDARFLAVNQGTRFAKKRIRSFCEWTRDTGVLVGTQQEKRFRIHTIRDLISLSELQVFGCLNIGRKTFTVMKAILTAHELEFGSEPWRE